MTDGLSESERAADLPGVELEDRVVAIVDSGDTDSGDTDSGDTDSGDTGGAAHALSERGFQVETLREEAEAFRLGPNQGGVGGALSKAAAIFGDEMRIVDQIGRALSEGNHVLVVSSGFEESADAREAAVRILREHGALAIWDFGSWTFVRAGSTEKGEEETG